MPVKSEPLPSIVYSCYFNVSRAGEQFVPDHIFSCQLSGSMVVNYGENDYLFNEGDFRFSRRNCLARFIKRPGVNGDFKTLAIRFDQDTLREFSAEYGYSAGKPHSAHPIVQLQPVKAYKDFVDSLIPYLLADQQMDQALIKLKLKEALLILLKFNPELKDVLFDFSEPGKIDLEGFMEKNFQFNVGLNRFAYMTGRSLATFKRDFQKIYQQSPSRWLVRRRLQEAHFQIKEQGKRPSDVYYNIGFEDFSHFSQAFRQVYGVSPSKLKTV